MVFVLGKLMRYGYLGLHVANSELETTVFQSRVPACGWFSQFSPSCGVQLAYVQIELSTHLAFAPASYLRHLSHLCHLRFWTSRILQVGREVEEAVAFFWIRFAG